MGKDDRRQKRMTRRFPIRYGIDAPKHLGFVKNLSLGGLEISGRMTFPLNSRLLLNLDRELGSIDLDGIVCWLADVDRLSALSGLKASIGVELVDRPDRWIEFALASFKDFKEERQHPRHGKMIKVIFEDAKELIEKYSQDISQGGIFVISKDVPAFDSSVELSLVIAKTMDVIRAEGTVVHVVTPEMAKEHGLNPGFGLQFTRFTDDDEKKLADYIASFTSDRC